MLMGVRMYANEQNARDAVAKLVAEELLPASSVCILTPAAGGEESAVNGAIQAKKLPGSHLRVAVEALRKGRTVLSVPLPYEGQPVMDVLDSFDPVDTGSLPVHYIKDPTPLSDTFALPVLIRSGSRARLMTDQRFIFRSFLGLPLLSKPKGPKTSSFGLPLLSKSVSKNSSFGLPLLSKNGTPLSSMFGLKTLTGPKR